MTSTESTVRTTMATLAASVTGLAASRIKLGVDDFGASVDFFKKFRSAAITTKALTSNVATITTSAAHNYEVGDVVTNVLDTPDTTFDGAYTVASVPTTTTYTFAKTASNVASTAATGLTMHTPYLVILPAVRTGLIVPQMDSEIEIIARLHFGFENNADYTFTAIEKILFPLMDAWQGVLGAALEGMTSSAPEMDSSLSPIVGKYEITLTLRGC